jgi:hemerythrin superfamily protein
MNAIELLMSQHRDVEKLFAALPAAKTAKQAQQIFVELADALAIHATIEEQVFYPESRQTRTQELLLDSVEEHLSVKRLLADLLHVEPGDPSFAAKCRVLEDQVQHHVEKEETELFPEVRRLLDDDVLEELGDKMEAIAAQLQAESTPRVRITEETAAAAPLE